LISVKTQIKELSEKRNKFEDHNKDLELWMKKKTELILEKLLWKLFNTGLSGNAQDGTLKMKSEDNKKNVELWMKKKKKALEKLRWNCLRLKMLLKWNNEDEEL